ncbi:hypothetical protein A2334_00770 [Candidatus Roizmanbacteria bacterium RIFOXYB2_FULL_38_10]|uniref:Uncharacterized protein n=1 Tax=Candidatus Roizmanbacteria bacterium RIFOXYD1_FULL_38_12 TaxID=1802093 RepID=A0A1F7L1I3_9BACT|nr:MAG: hypothetical protein A3K47_04065 [Candidatus Roizmanbacteria bacterium RIFOXYA2_FULL_38_14]OGK63933.1 MAG: hypothetical protein A3K27_04065 [Candidatus Roizmanbacteria bacterium RIFOXYA1_FULL_37_12]OGK65779.1 MAG: hypothetical protein A3K38_04065 [Candidatus Roizmanbacteria bacterium RIFOXYB1_FULL_40_23]OGK68887.1 MAG: hypothetical protein A2334_00770 [Candidatus Roizmanbacteria bacterium RIFOXYB2_FULL_38_10]OGK70184.1 MAG: hypothetical protein A3K21_04070 [Candidatus Roizmanbacteria ba
MRQHERAEIATILTIGTLLVITITAAVSSVFLKDKKTTGSRAAGIVYDPTKWCFTTCDDEESGCLNCTAISSTEFSYGCLHYEGNNYYYDGEKKQWGDEGPRNMCRSIKRYTGIPTSTPTPTEVPAPTQTGLTLVPTLSPDELDCSRPGNCTSNSGDCLVGRVSGYCIDKPGGEDEYRCCIPIVTPSPTSAPTPTHPAISDTCRENDCVINRECDYSRTEKGWCIDGEDYGKCCKYVEASSAPASPCTDGGGEYIGDACSGDTCAVGTCNNGWCCPVTASRSYNITGTLSGNPHNWRVGITNADYQQISETRTTYGAFTLTHTYPNGTSIPSDCYVYVLDENGQWKSSPNYQRISSCTLDGGIVVTLIGDTAPPGMVQGRLILEDGVTLPSAVQINVKNNGVDQQTFSLSQHNAPYGVSSFVVGDSYTATCTAPTGYACQYSKCENNVTCHTGGTYTDGNTVSGTIPNMPADYDRGYIDLYWKVVPTTSATYRAYLPIVAVGSGGANPTVVNTPGGCSSADIRDNSTGYNMDVNLNIVYTGRMQGSVPQNDCIYNGFFCSLYRNNIQENSIRVDLFRNDLRGDNETVYSTAYTNVDVKNIGSATEKTFTIPWCTSLAGKRIQAQLTYMTGGGTSMMLPSQIIEGDTSLGNSTIDLTINSNE